MYANSIHTIDLRVFLENLIKFENKNILKNKKKVITSKYYFRVVIKQDMCLIGTFQQIGN